MRATILFLLVATAATACGGGSPPTAYQAPANNQPGQPTTPTGGGSTSSSVAISDNAFAPDSTTLGIGTTVTWSWNGAGYSSHNVTFADGSTSGNKTAGTFTRTFNAAGKYVYTCTNHPGMRGVVMIQ